MRERAIDRSASLVVLVCALTFVGGYALKARCTALQWDGQQYAQLCYNDIQPLYGQRGVEDRVFPYIDGRLVDGELKGGAIEYPVLTGLFMWATGLLVSDWGTYLLISAILLAPFGLLVAYLLARMSGARAFLWSAAPAMVLYAFHNWDLLVVAAAVAGFWLWSRGRSRGAAALFGVGAAVKMFPIFFLGPLVLERWHTRGWRDALKCGAVGIGTWALINLPFVLIDRTGWWTTYEFHRLRTADFNSIWIWGLRSGESLRDALAGAGSLAFDAARLNLLTSGLTAASFLVALGVGWWRARREGTYPVVQVCGALLVAFMLWNKVHSPQYALWLLPFFVLIGIHWFWWVAYSIADLAVYIGIFRWFYDFSVSQNAATMTAAKWTLVWGVRARGLLLLLLFVAFLMAKKVRVERSAETQTTVVSQGSPSVIDAGDRGPVRG